MHLPRPLLFLALSAPLLAPALRAQNATWTGAADTSWSNNANWTPATSPSNGSATATFNASSGAASVNITGISLGTLTFASDAQATTLTAGVLTFHGSGIVNNSSVMQTITSGYIDFYNSASVTGPVTLTSNVMTVADSASLGSATVFNNGDLYFQNNATGGTAALINGPGMVDFGSNILNQTLGSLAGGGSVTLYGGSTLTVGSLGTSTTFSGAISEGGPANLTKVGAGTLTLSGNSSYSGTTTVAGGTLLVNGSSGTTLGSGNDVIVQNGATLGGTGLIGNNDVKILAGGHVAPGGNGVGTLSLNSNLLLHDGAALDFQLGTVSDRINTGLLGGTLYDWENAGGITLNISNAGGFVAGTYPLFDFTGGFTMIAPANLTLGSVIAGYDYSLALNGNYLELTATVSAIPEPATYAAIFGAGALGLAAWRRRRRSCLFPAESAARMEVRSAGPDKKL
jgi:autotransporter-associated beta strand protein